MSKGLILINGDTDSITVGKPDGSPFSEEEQEQLLAELNEQFPEHIKFEADGYFPTAIVFAAKNYALFDGKKIKTKGSSIKDQKKEPALRKFLDEIIEAIIQGRENYKEIYDRYAIEIMDLKDIKPWCSKVTYTEKVDTGTGTRQVKMKAAMANSDYKPGDKAYMFQKEDGSLCLAENFEGDYDKVKLLKRLYDTAQVFDTVLPTKELFINYSLKKSGKKALEALLNAQKT